ncbi:ATP-binding protein [Aquimarina brevivitae]|uniref:histidine kinase n=1 Tax=Aquimarina brevivitae TaxID=323412 RepID=A0A4Q7NXH0_9FLAO|nr:ATP-binding protein [Aquimarina brevivitae]RZS91934.1 cyclic nucleotide-binding protein [Aquimarina brevivitae]
MEVATDQLQSISAFASVPIAQLQWFITNAKLAKKKKGDFLFKKGDAIEDLILILQGKIEIKIEQNGHYKTIDILENQDISGVLPFSRLSSALGFGEVIEDTKALMLHKSYFKEMIAEHYELTEVFVHHMTTRVREFTKSNVQAEKMMALGKLSAGLAHELNNPASAMLRSAKALKQHLSHVPEKFKKIISIQASEDTINTINDILFANINNKPENNMKLMERNEKEDELEEWLEDHGVDNAYELTETLLDFCMDIDKMEEIYNAGNTAHFPQTIEWIENVLTTEKMVGEIEEASNRITALIQSIKSYTHMDRAPEKTKEDVHKGIKSTLTMLNHKLKQKNITVVENFEEDLPAVEIFVSEINQVWTNLIDNAIDAMAKNGTLEIKTAKENSHIMIQIIDDGPGIAEENISKIFDPFFTTKAIGEGTGMGLEVVHRIIKQHQGTINVTSEPGETIFTICLPN